MTLNEEHLAILRHTLSRAAGRRYCGDSAAMQELVSAGLMVPFGKTAFCPDPYFGITADGRAAVRNADQPPGTATDTRPRLRASRDAVAASRGAPIPGFTPEDA